MLACHVVVDETVLAAFDQPSHAGQWGSRRTGPDAIRAVAAPDLRALRYLVFDRRKLVAAFARRDDAEHWIEEFGHPRMKLREVSKQGKVAGPKASGQ